MLVSLEHRTTLSDPTVTLESGIFEVGPNVEVENFGANVDPPLPALVDIDVADTSILISLIIDQPLSAVERFRFTHELTNIPLFQNVSVDPSTNWTGFTQSRLVLGSEIIVVNVSLLTGQTGQFILLNVTPEPGAAGLLGYGAALLLNWARRRPIAVRVT